MKNEKGSILVITLGFVLIFLMVGFSSVYYATTQKELVEKEESSVEAFWLAEGYVNLAKSMLPDQLLNESNTVDTFRTYNIQTKEIERNSSFIKWQILSNGLVHGQKREILADVLQLSTQAATCQAKSESYTCPAPDGGQDIIWIKIGKKIRFSIPDGAPDCEAHLRQQKDLRVLIGTALAGTGNNWQTVYSCAEIERNILDEGFTPTVPDLSLLVSVAELVPGAEEAMYLLKGPSDESSPNQNEEITLQKPIIVSWKEK